MILGLLTVVLGAALWRFVNETLGIICIVVGLMMCIVAVA